jgi:Protein of unknown function (DUF1592)/Protein of unknown function (DUF1587)/Protein of unknown function (DUF1595)/Ankyrin repeats (3 copies)/Ankyrin repeats (many copies)
MSLTRLSAVRVLGASALVLGIRMVAGAAAADGELRLVDAARSEDWQAVRTLVNQRADVNIRSHDGGTALLWAAHWNDLDTADLLIRAGANANASNDLRMTPLSRACTNGSAVLVERLLKAGADPNAPIATGETPLMTCAGSGSADTVRMLIASGADVNAKEPSQKLKTANLLLDKADAEHVFNSTEIWEKVIAKLRTRAMPPPGHRRPGNAEADAAAAWLETELDRAAASHPNPGRSPDLHRLNRAEYDNAIRDLLGVEIDASSMLSPDEHAYGFDNNADALSVTPALQDRYLTAAVKIARLAVGDPTLRPGFERYTAVRNNSNERTWLWQTDRLGEEFPLGSRGGIAARHYFPVDGEYVFKVQLDRTYTGMIRGLNVPNEIEIRIDGNRVVQFTLGGQADVRAADASADPGEDANSPLYTADDALQVRVPLKAGLRQVIITVVKSDAVKAEGLGPARIPIWSHDYDGDIRAPLVVSVLLIGGPYNGKLPQDSPSRRRIFTCYPANSREETACATKILSTLARRAYRRPATDDDVQTLLGFYKSGRTEGNFESGVRAALERLLVSPDFLFRIESDPDRIARSATYRISDVELASRLSFFLWSSIPDDELLDLAIRRKLRDANVLDRQVRRMLTDPLARTALVENFFGQWLQTRNVWLQTPDANRKFPWFDDNLRTAFVRETELHLTLLDKMGVPIDKLGDSTGKFRELSEISRG